MYTRAMGRRVLLAAMGAVAVSSCSLAVSLDGLTGGGHTGDGGLAAADGAIDAPTTDAAADVEAGGGLEPSLLAHTGGTYATGDAQQVHLVYATHARLWWLFVADAATPNAIGTRSSDDFVTWTAGPALTLPAGHDGDGRNFSVAYADRNGRDVVHLSISLRPDKADFRHYHARAAIDGAQLAFEGPDLLDEVPANDDTLVPDGPSTAVASSGIVVDTSGLSMKDDGGTGYGNEYAWRSTASDNGAPTWKAAWNARDIVEVVPLVSNARALVPFASDSVLAMWEKADVEPNPTDVRFSRIVGTTWSASGNVFGRSDPLDKNDWSVWRVTDTEVHAVRRSLAGAFDHRIFDGTKWQGGAQIARDPGVAGTGLVLVGRAGGVTLVQIGSDAANSLRTSTFANGAWSAWTTLLGTPAARTSLTRASTTGPAALVWTETKPGAGQDIAGLLLPN